jgi:nucleoside-diphosphate-sugar epimerase
VTLQVLFIGGTGTISASCAREAVRQGLDVTVLNRGVTTTRDLPEEVTRLTADTEDPAAMREAIGDRAFDAVVDWIAFHPDQVRRDIDLFAGRCGQYVFISSAAAYRTPPNRLPLTESSPLGNREWRYARDKIACEDLLVQAHREHDFPMTIVRPSLTYDETIVPFDGGWTVIERMRQGKPIVVHGDGTSLWTMTHARDFAVGFTGLLGRDAALGEAFHITGDEAPTWDRIYRTFAAAAGVADPELVHVPSDAIEAVDDWWGVGLLTDKAHSLVFDNAKIKSLVPEFGLRATPLKLGAREIVAWFDAHPEHQWRDEKTDANMDRLIAAYRPRPLD